MSALSFTPPKPVKLNGSRTWYFRLRVPNDLKAVYAPRTEFKFSLHTENRKEALSRIMLKAQQLEQEFCEHRRRNAHPSLMPQAQDAPISKARSGVSGFASVGKTGPQAAPFADVTELELERLVLLYPHEALSADEAERKALRPDMAEARQQWDEDQAFQRQLHEAKGLTYAVQPFKKLVGLSEEARTKKHRYASLFLGAAHSFLSEGETEVIQPVADAHLEAHGITPPAPDDKAASAQYQKFCIELMVQELTVQTAVLNRLRGEWVNTPPVPGVITVPVNAAVPPVSAPAVVTSPQADVLAPSDDNPPFSVVWQKYLDERKPTAGTIRTYRAAIRRFIELVGDLPIKAMTKSHVRQFKDTLAKTPTNLPRSMDAAPWPEVLAWVDDQLAQGKDVTFISPRTINEGRLVALSTVFAYAVRNGYIDDNPSSGIRAFEQKTKTRKPTRNPYTEQDIETIFKQSSLFNSDSLLGTLPQGRRASRRGKVVHAPVSASAIMHDYRWLLLLGMFTGARIEELAHLNLEDVQERRGVACLSIHESEDGTHTIKTATAQRLIPVHPRLVELGFLRHVATLRKRGETRLFWTFLPNAQNKMSDKFTDWWKTYTEELGIRPVVAKKQESSPRVFTAFGTCSKTWG